MTSDSNKAGTKQKSEYLTQDEARKVLAALSSADRAKILVGARQFSLGTGMEFGDLLGEVVARVLEGTRQIPRNGAIVSILIMDIRSVACAERQKREREELVDPADFNDGKILPGLAPSAEAVTSNVQHLDQLVARLEEEFADDPAARAVLIGRMEGHTKEETMAQGSIADSEFEAARKRVTRALAVLGEGRSRR